MSSPLTIKLNRSQSKFATSIAYANRKRAQPVEIGESTQSDVDRLVIKLHHAKQQPAADDENFPAYQWKRSTAAQREEELIARKRQRVDDALLCAEEVIPGIPDVSIEELKALLPTCEYNDDASGDMIRYLFASGMVLPEDAEM